MLTRFAPAPTGFLHLGSYFGAVQNYVRMQDEYECCFTWGFLVITLASFLDILTGEKIQIES